MPATRASRPAALLGVTAVGLTALAVGGTSVARTFQLAATPPPVATTASVVAAPRAAAPAQPALAAGPAAGASAQSGPASVPLPAPATSVRVDGGTPAVPAAHGDDGSAGHD